MINKIVLLLLTMLMINSTFANPVDGAVTAGSATITSPNSTTVQINQTSDKAIIDWQSFNLSPNETTRFVQPNANSVTLNRINPQQGASQIFGQLQANGQIILVNQAGIYFGPGSRVDVGGIIASTTDISNENFLAGYYNFDQTSSLYNGSVINEGTIVAANHGLVALIGSAVSNDGVIQAHLGSIVLASGNAFTLGFDSTGMINFTVSEPTATAGIDQHGVALKNAVSNKGSIISDGGTILMSAKSVQGVMDQAINMEGLVQARSVSEKNGTIIFSGDQGTTYVSGKVDATGLKTGEKGGVVQILGNYVHVDGASEINVSGDLGGGKINIGGNYQGKGPLQNASTTYVAKDVKLYADATTYGNGGDIITWADLATGFQGSISAQGGIQGGNGGFAEVSGKEYLNIDELRVDLSATHGDTGTLLLDPANITLTTGAADSNVDFNSGTYTPNTNTVSNIRIDGATGIISRLGNTNVVISATQTAGGNLGTITVAAPISWSSANSLTLTAASDITMNGSITNAGTGAIIMNSGRNVSLNSNIAASGTVSITSTGTTTINGSLNVGILNINSAGTNMNGGTITTTGAQNYTGAVTLGANTTITGNALQFQNAIAGGGFNATFSGLGVDIIFQNSITGVNNLLIQNVNKIYMSGVNTSITTTGTQTFGSRVWTNAANPSTTTFTGAGISFNGDLIGFGNSFVINDSGVTTLNSANTINTLQTNAVRFNNAITTTGAQTYNGAATFAADATLSTTNSAISFNSTINGGSKNVTLSTGSGNITINGSASNLRALALNSTGLTSVNNSLNATSVSTNAGGTTTFNAANVVTTGAQTYNDAVTFGGVGISTFSSSGGNGITFNSTLNGPQGLSIANNSGAVTFNSNIGNTLASLTIGTGSPTAFNGASLQTITTTGAQTYNSAVTLSSGSFGLFTSLGGAGITMGSTLDGSRAFITEVNSGPITFNGIVGGITPLPSITVRSPSFINTTAITTSGGQSWDGAVNLTAGSLITLTSGNNINFSDTLDGPQSLSIVNSNGSVTFAGSVGGNSPLSSLLISTAGNGRFVNVNTSNITTTGSQTYNRTILIGSLTPATTFTTTNSVINFSDITNLLPSSVTINAGSGAINLNGSIGANGNINSLTLNSTGATTIGNTVNAASITTNAGGTTVISGNNLATSGSQTYNDAVSFNGSATLSSNDTITLANTLNAFANNVSIFADNAIVFAGGASSITGTGTISLAPNTNTRSIGINGAAGNLSINAATLAALDTTFSSLNIGRSGQIGTITIPTVLFNVPTTLQSASISASGNITTSGSNSLTLNGPVALSGATLFSSTTGNISFLNTITGGSNTLGITTSGSGVISFNNTISNLATLTTMGTTALNGGSITSSGAQNYNGASTLGCRYYT